MGGSTNTVLHTLALANEAGIEDYDLERINDIAKRVPYLPKLHLPLLTQCMMFTKLAVFQPLLKNWSI